MTAENVLDPEPPKCRNGVPVGFSLETMQKGTNSEKGHTPAIIGDYW